MSTPTKATRARILCAEIQTRFEQPNKRTLKLNEALDVLARCDGRKNHHVVASAPTDSVTIPPGEYELMWGYVEKDDGKIWLVAKPSSTKYEFEHVTVPQTTTPGASATPFEGMAGHVAIRVDWTGKERRSGQLATPYGVIRAGASRYLIRPRTGEAANTHDGDSQSAHNWITFTARSEEAVSASGTTITIGNRSIDVSSLGDVKLEEYAVDGIRIGFQEYMDTYYPKRMAEVTQTTFVSYYGDALNEVLGEMKYDIHADVLISLEYTAAQYDAVAAIGTAAAEAYLRDMARPPQGERHCMLLHSYFGRNGVVGPHTAR